MSMFETVGEGYYDPSTDSLHMRKVDDVASLTDIMSVSDIEAYVNEHLTYRKGWKFSAQDRESYVSVFVEFWADNSTPFGVEDMRERVIGEHRFDLFSGTREHVQCEILAHVMSIEAHEATEFLRFDGFAPFHPHRADGRERYSDAQNSHAGLPEVSQ
jgi:hypothetical protein